MSTSITANPSLVSSHVDVAAPPPSPPQSEEGVSVAQTAAVSEAPRFTNPVIKVDSDTGLALLVVRNADTGKEIETYPSRKVVEEYSRHQAPDTVKAAPVADGGQSLAVDAKAPPAPVVSAAPVSAAPAPSSVHVATGTSPVSAPSHG